MHGISYCIREVWFGASSVFRYVGIKRSSALCLVLLSVPVSNPARHPVFGVLRLGMGV